MRLVFTWRRYDPARDDREVSQLRRVALRGGRVTILVKEINQESFGDHANSANVTPEETIWVREVATPCIETRIVVDRHGKRRMTAPTPREIRALARDGSTLYAITSAPTPCGIPPDTTRPAFTARVPRGGMSRKPRALQGQKWRRRELNPRPQSRKRRRLRAYPALYISLLTRHAGGVVISQPA